MMKRRAPMVHIATTISVLVFAATATAAKLKQTITFAQPPDQPFNAPAITLTATASSGLAVAFESRTNSVCTVKGNAVTPVAIGKCTIRASQGGNATYAAAPTVDRGFAIAKGAQTISFGALTDRWINAPPLTLSASASSGLAVSFGSLSNAVCGVAGTAVTLVAVGTCTLRASQSGNSIYAAAPSVDRSFTVSAASTLQYIYDGAGNVVRIQRGP